MLWRVSKIFVLSLGLSFSVHSAQACSVASDQYGVMSPSDAVIPKGAFAAEVEIIKVGSVWSDPLEARIIMKRQGNFLGSRLLIDRWNSNSCKHWPQLGERGLIVGWLKPESQNVAWLEAFATPSYARLEAEKSRSRIQWAVLIIAVIFGASALFIALITIERVRRD